MNFLSPKYAHELLELPTPFVARFSGRGTAKLVTRVYERVVSGRIKAHLWGHPPVTMEKSAVVFLKLYSKDGVL